MFTHYWNWNNALYGDAHKTQPMCYNNYTTLGTYKRYEKVIMKMKTIFDSWWCVLKKSPRAPNQAIVEVTLFVTKNYNVVTVKPGAA